MDRVMKIDLDKVDDENAEVYYEQLSELDVDDVDNTEELRHAFYVVQTLMTLKFEQSKIMEDDAREKEEKIRTLQEQNKELETENREFQRLGAGASDRELIMEKREWELERERYENEVQEVNQKLQEVMRERDELSTSKASLERQTERLTDETKRLQENFDYLKTQNEQLRERAAGGGKGDDIQQRKEIANLRADLRAKKAKIDSLEDQSHQGWEEIEQLKNHLAQSTADIERLTDEHAKMKAIVKEQDRHLEDKINEVELLKSQVSALQDQQRQRGDVDDDIMVFVNNKTEEWKGLLAEREAEIVQLHVENRKLRQQLHAADVDSDKASVNALYRALQEREAQIKTLEENLKTATEELATNADLIEEMRRNMDATGRGPSDRQAERIRELQQMMKDKEEMVKELDRRRVQAEQDAEGKDTELLEANERMRQYEEGEYGLADAVAEIKAGKAQIGYRERQIEELCQHVNKAEMDLHDLRAENEHLRMKLGIPLDDPVDIEEYKKMKAVKREEERALNMILQKEIEEKEDECLLLKAKVRDLARQLGQRAGTVGLAVDDVLNVDALGRDRMDGVEDEIRMQRVGTAASAAPAFNMSFGLPAETLGGSRRGGETQEGWKIRVNEMNKEIAKNLKELDAAGREKAELEARLEQMDKESRALESALRELKEGLSRIHVAPDSGQQLECPVLDKLLAAMDAKRLMGDFDTGLYMKARVDNLEGRNEELRRELREARIEVGSSRTQLEKARERLERVENELQALRDVGAGTGPLQALSALPEGMAPSSSETIASLNEQLVHVLQEVSLKEEMIKKMDGALDSYRRKFALVRHQQGLLYQEQAEAAAAWEEEKTRLQGVISKLEGNAEEDKARLVEFDRLVDTLAQDEPEVRRRLAEASRRMTVLAVNEKALVRRYNAKEDVEKNLRRENNRLKNDIIQMETIVTERLGYYRRYKDMAAFKVNALQKALDDSVPRLDQDRLQRKHDELLEKYRDFLEKNNALVSRAETFDRAEAEVQQLRLDGAALKKALETEKEKRYALEAAMETMEAATGKDGKKALSDGHVISIAKKVSMLEMRSLNETERADHASRMYDNLKLSAAQLDTRNRELEDKFAELTRINLEAQRTERELRDELANCVSKAVSDADRKQMENLEKANIKLRHEVDKLKEISDIASYQAKTFQEQQICREKEMTSLRQQLLDFQSQSDEKTIIGKLHRHIVHLQLSESTSLRKLDQSNRKALQLEAHVMRFERRIDEKDQTLYHSRMESRAKAKHLKDTINALRSQFAGSVPLTKQEKFTKTLLQLQEEKSRSLAELRAAEEERHSAQEELGLLKVRHDGMQELMATLKDARGASKVVEWHQRLEELRLEQMKAKRMNDRLRQQMKHLENVIKSQETQIVHLEEENVRVAKEYEERQIAWEQRESELERTLANFETAQGEVVGVAGRLRQAQGGSSLPDPNLPLPNQLDQAVATIKKNLKTIFDQQAEVKAAKQRVKELEVQLKESERTLLKRERYISELRLRLPATEDREERLRAASADAWKAVESAGDVSYVEEKTLHAAQTTVSALQQRLAQKEEALERSRQLLQEARQELEEGNRKHSDEMNAMLIRLNAKTDDGVNKLQHVVKKIVTSRGEESITNRQLARLNELEDLVTEQSKAMALQSEQINMARRQTEEWRAKYDTVLKATQAEKELLQEEHREATDKLQGEVDKHQGHLVERQREVDSLLREIELQKRENARAPSTTMRHLVERLRTQLVEKEKQHKALSKALMELRADMVKQAEDTLKVTSAEAAQERDVHKILEKHTKEIAGELETVKDQLGKARKELRRIRDEKEAQGIELEDAKTDLMRKENQIGRMKADRDRLEQELEETRRKVDRMKGLRRVNPDDNLKTELEELKRKTRLLEEENRRWRLQAEKPYEQQVEPLIPAAVYKERLSAPPRDDKPKDGVARWEETKNAQRAAARLREKLKARDLDVERLTRELERTKEELVRANKDREMLARGPGQPLFDGVDQRALAVDDLRRRNRELEEEAARLRGGVRFHGSAPAPMEQQLEIRCRHLQERVDELERSARGQPVVSVELDRLRERERALQRENLQLNEEKIQFRYELESARHELPLLKEKVNELQKYTELLKAEKATLEGQTDRSLASTTSSVGNLRRIGDSGRSQKDLEKTIARLKKVVERVQQENERLKKAPGVVSNDHLSQLRLENSGLKSQLEELRLSMGAKLADRYEAKERGTQRLMEEHERLRRELMNEADSHEKTRRELAKLEHELEQQRRDNFAAKTDTDSRRGSTASRIYESRVRELEAQVDAKSAAVESLRRQLREATRREQELTLERNRLSRQQTAPPADIMALEKEEVGREYQRLKLQNERLEAEKRVLTDQLTRATGHEVGPNIAEQLDHLNKVLEENVELRIQVKQLEFDKERLARYT